MKRFLWLFLISTAFAQSPVTVTGTVVDATNNPATSGYVQFDIQPQPTNVAFSIPGSLAVVISTATCGIDGTGHVLNKTLTGPCLVWGNDLISPANTCYTVTLAPSSVPLQTIPNELITGGSYELSSPRFCTLTSLVPQYSSITTAPVQANIAPAIASTYNVGLPQDHYAGGYFDHIYLGGQNTEFTTFTSLVKIVNGTPGADLGALANAADAALGSTGGDIWIAGGGNFATQFSAASGPRTVRMFPGTYTSTVGIANAGTPWSPTFVMGNNSNLKCEGWDTIIKESTTLINLPTIVGPKPMFATLGNKTSTATSSNLQVEGCHFQGVGLTPNTFGGTVECGNTVNCKVLNNWFDTVQSIAVNAGGNSSTGNFADNVEIAGNLVTNSIEVEFAVVNGQNVNIHDNIHRDPGTTGAGMVDIEPNISTDRAKDIDIHDNTYDLRAGTGGSLFCVTVQIGTIADATKQGVKVHDNTCRGSDPATGGGHLINGITASGRYVEVYNNTITGAIQGGILASNLDVGNIHDNTVVCSSSLGYNAYEIALQGNVTNVDVYNNKTYNDAGCPGAIASKKANIAEVGAGNNFNKFWNNVTQGITILGANSKIISNIDPAGGYTLGSGGFGVSTTVNGGLNMSPLVAPTLQLIRTTAGGAFAAGTYFWKVTALNAAGETAGSNEITGSPTLNQKAEIQWSASPGSTGYGIYRGMLSGNETLCTTVSSGAVFYSDTGTACPGAVVPTTNTAGGIIMPQSIATPCDAAHRGMQQYTPGAGGVKDTIQVCGKDAADVYAYRPIY